MPVPERQEAVLPDQCWGILKAHHRDEPRHFVWGEELADLRVEDFHFGGACRTKTTSSRVRKSG
jgi:hypothetical protein